MEQTNEELQEAAAQRLYDLDQAVRERDAELLRIYEISSVLHNFVARFLENPPVCSNDEEQEGLNLLIDSVYAIENGVTIDTARQFREEEMDEDE